MSSVFVSPISKYQSNANQMSQDSHSTTLKALPHPPTVSKYDKMALTSLVGKRTDGTPEPRRYREVRVPKQEYVVIRETFDSGKVFHHLLLTQYYTQRVLGLAKDLLEDFDSEHTGCLFSPIEQKPEDYGMSASTGTMFLFRYVSRNPEYPIESSKDYALKFRVAYWTNDLRRFQKNGVCILGLQSIDNMEVLANEYTSDDPVSPAPKCSSREFL